MENEIVTVDESVDQVNEIDYEMLNETLTVFKETNEQLLETNQELAETNNQLLEKIELLLDDNDETFTLLGDSNLTTNELLENIHQELTLNTSTIQVYGLIVVPFIIVCIMLWWFFKQFLYKF